MFALFFLAALIVNAQELKVARSFKNAFGFSLSNLSELDNLAKQQGCPEGKAGHYWVPSECAYTSGGFHLVCGLSVPYNNASAVCAQYGWREAEVDDINSMHAAAVMRVCVGPNNGAWMKSFNGLTGEPCMLGLGIGVVLTGGGDWLCGSDGLAQTAQVLCQEVPTVTSTTVVLTTWSVAQGATTTTVTETVHKKKPGRRGRWPHLPNSESVDFSFKMQKPVDGGCRQCPSGHCDEVCPFQYPTLRIVEVEVPFSQAEQVCRRHGWRLAAITLAMIADARDLFSLCFGPRSLIDDSSEPRWVWIKSYNGVEAATCNAFDGDVVVYPMSADVCSSSLGKGRGWILCQTDGPNVAESDGGYASPPWAATTTTSSTVMEVRPSTTETRTVTVTAKKCGKGERQQHHFP